MFTYNVAVPCRSEMLLYFRFTECFSIEPWCTESYKIRSNGRQQQVAASLLGQFRQLVTHALQSAVQILKTASDENTTSGPSKPGAMLKRRVSFHSTRTVK